MFNMACTHGYLHVAKYIISIGYLCYNTQLFIDMCGIGNLEIVIFLKDVLKNITWLDILLAYWTSIKYEKLYITNWLIDIIKNNVSI